LSTDTPEPVRRELLTVGSQYQQFAAWLAQDAMDAAGARRHYAAAPRSCRSRVTWRGHRGMPPKRSSWHRAVKANRAGSVTPCWR
jgi:hypothetical protein